MDDHHRNVVMLNAALVAAAGKLEEQAVQYQAAAKADKGDAPLLASAIFCGLALATFAAAKAVRGTLEGQ